MIRNKYLGPYTLPRH